MPIGLYLSVPFCRTKCSYCNFASDVFSRSAYENYVSRIVEEIANSRHVASQMGCHIEEAADSIYLGGGTPSVLENAQLLRIFSALRAQFAVAPDAEITVECAPGTLNPPLIETLLQCGVNRVSLGVQSFVDREAHSVGRLHQRSTVVEEIGRLRQAGLQNINLDLIAGLPHQTPESWAFSLSETMATGVPHASVYMLEVDDESRLGRELIAGGSRYHAHFVPDDDQIADFYQQACEWFAADGLLQYEISNFARAGHQNESRHNLKYWTRQPYLGFGVDAHSMAFLWQDFSVGENVHALRFATPDSLDGYMNRQPYAVTPVSEQAAIEEAFFLGLRLNCGIDLNRLQDESWLQEGSIPARAELGSEISAGRRLPPGSTPDAQWRAATQECLRDGLLEQQESIVRLTSRGRLLSNEVFARFLAPDISLQKVQKQKWETVP